MKFIDAIDIEQLEKELLKSRDKEFVFNKSIQMRRFKVACIKNDYYDEGGKCLRTNTRWCWYVEGWSGKKVYSNVSGRVRYFGTVRLAKKNFVAYLRKGKRQTLC